MKNTIRINELPTRTWNRLGVNAAEIEWDTAAVLPPQVLAVGAGEHPAPLRLDVRDIGACTEQTVTLHAAADSDACLVLTAAAAHPLALRLDAALDAGARVRVILLENPTQGATVRVETRATCAAGAKIEYLYASVPRFHKIILLRRITGRTQLGNFTLIYRKRKSANITCINLFHFNFPPLIFIITRFGFFPRS